VKKITAIILILLSGLSSAQTNLVSNSSFELHTACPSNLEQFDLATNWYKINLLNSSDLFDICATNPIVSVPKNNGGWQYAHSGNAYAGISTFVEPFHFRDFIINHLQHSLLAGKKYCISFFVSLADTSKFSNNSIGLKFFDTLFYVDNSHADGYNLGLITDLENFGVQLNNTMGWTELAWEYIAKGGESYMMIGNFRDDYTSDTTVSNIGNPPFAYYYIDDVSLVYCGEDTIPPEPIENSMTVVSAFTPNGDGVNDLYYVKGINISSIQMKIVNRWGQLLYEATGENPGWDGKYNGNEVSEGVYYYIVEVIFKNGEVRNKAGAIHLIR
jgi:gliding motility-associated-like protein